MMLKRSTTESKPRAVARLVRAALVSLAAASAIAVLATGCLDRKLCPKPGDPTSSCSPQTSNVFVSQIIQTSVDKIDLLFMIDNSTSMADKQQILEDAVPVLVSRLITPICVDDNGAPTGGTDNAGQCTKGQPEFTPINDIHIGIVSSSLGAHGNTDAGLPCVATAMGHINDNAHMIGSVRDPAFPLSSSWNGTGFLAWDPNGIDKPVGTKDAGTLTKTFTNMIDATGQDGCGYEAQLESWYRFLIDPEPPASVDKVVPAGSSQAISVRSSSMAVGTDGKLVLDANGKPTCTGCDPTVLAQRAAFLRPDSLVAIVMLSDENDCSIRDDGVGWFVANSKASMPRATAACDANPNDPCCFSCAQGGTTPANCPTVATDTVCKATPTYMNDKNLGDNLNLRCFNQRKRFGFDLLYETDRYVQGLSNGTLFLQSQLETTGKQVSITNPLYDTQGSGKAPRPSSLVFLAGIVGVPWQDVADDASLAGPGLTYLTASELKTKGRWADLLGDPTPTPAGSPPVPPSDPFMIESIDPRSGTNPIINVPIVAATSMNPTASPINGHEQNIPTKNDLQYACTFKLKMSRTCTADNNACDCTPNKSTTPNSDIIASNSPLCQPEGGGAPTTTQIYAKGYPGSRELQVLKDFGDNAIVASICPKKVIPDDPTNAANDPDYGYNPAVGAIIERLKEALKGKCLPRPIETDTKADSATFGQVLCKVIEAKSSGCDCTVPGSGRSPADQSILPAVQAQLAATGNCSDGTDKTDPRPLCTTWCECEINQLTGADLQACQAGNSTTPGYCYVDAAAEVTNPAAQGQIAKQLAKCPATQQQLLTFVDAPTQKTPAQGAVAFIACLGAAVVQVSGTAGTSAM